MEAGRSRIVIPRAAEKPEESPRRGHPKKTLKGQPSIRLATFCPATYHPLAANICWRKSLRSSEVIGRGRDQSSRCAVSSSTDISRPSWKT